MKLLLDTHTLYLVGQKHSLTIEFFRVYKIELAYSKICNTHSIDLNTRLNMSKTELCRIRGFEN